MQNTDNTKENPVQNTLSPQAQPEPTTSNKQDGQAIKQDDQTILGAPGIIIPSHLAMIAEIQAVNGFVKIRTYDGKEHLWPPGKLAAMARDCMNLLQRFSILESQGKKIPSAVRRQVMELCEKTEKAAFAARHQQESAGRYDYATKGVKRALDRLDWQKGLKPEFGEYTEEDIKEEANIRYYCTQFPYLTESEVGTILRAKDVPWKVRITILRHMNAKRQAEDVKSVNIKAKEMLTNGAMPEHLLPKKLIVDMPKQSPQKAPAPKAASSKTEQEK